MMGLTVPLLLLIPTGRSTKEFTERIFSGDDGEDSTTAPTGASGFGKTTLLGVLAGLEEADRGDILIDGKPCPLNFLAAWPFLGLTPDLLQRSESG